MIVTWKKSELGQAINTPEDHATREENKERDADCPHVDEQSDSESDASLCVLVIVSQIPGFYKWHVVVSF